MSCLDEQITRSILGVQKPSYSKIIEFNLVSCKCRKGSGIQLKIKRWRSERSSEERDVMPNCEDRSSVRESGGAAEYSAHRYGADM